MKKIITAVAILVATLTNAQVKEGSVSYVMTIEGLPPDLVDAPPGCPFQPRCPYAIERCLPENPSLEPVVPGHRIACWVDVTGGREPHAEPVAQGV